MLVGPSRSHTGDGRSWRVEETGEREGGRREGRRRASEFTIVRLDVSMISADHQTLKLF